MKSLPYLNLTWRPPEVCDRADILRSQFTIWTPVAKQHRQIPYPYLNNTMFGGVVIYILTQWPLLLLALVSTQCLLWTALTFRHVSVPDLFSVQMPTNSILLAACFWLRIAAYDPRPRTGTGRWLGERVVSRVRGAPMGLAPLLALLLVCVPAYAGTAERFAEWPEDRECPHLRPDPVWTPSF